MSAVFSPCRRWRYSLERELPGSLFLQGTLVVIAMNPSTADETSLDPTCRKCIGFAQRLGCASYRMLNLYAWRSTDPKALLTVDDPVGPDNDEAIRVGTEGARYIVCAWGTLPHDDRPKQVTKMLLDLGRALHAFRFTKITNVPEHPLFIPYSDTLLPYGGAT